jgi:hypothetical protein
MDQTDAKRDGLDKQGANGPKGNGLPKNVRKTFYGEFWANNPWAIWGCVIGSVLVSPIVNFPHCTKRDWCFIAGGLCIWLVTCVYWYFDGKSRLKIPTEEEINERFRQETDKSFDEVDADLDAIQKSVAEQRENVDEVKKIVSNQGNKIDSLDKEVRPRRLTDWQISYIAGHLRSRNHKFRFVVHFSRGSGDAGMFAHDIHKALMQAGWEIIANPQQHNDQFKPLEFRVNDEDYKSKSPEITALVDALTATGVVENSVSAIFDNKIPRGDLYIWVGTRV